MSGVAFQAGFLIGVEEILVSFFGLGGIPLLQIEIGELPSFAGVLFNERFAFLYGFRIVADFGVVLHLGARKELFNFVLASSFAEEFLIVLEERVHVNVVGSVPGFHKEPVPDVVFLGALEIFQGFHKVFLELVAPAIVQDLEVKLVLAFAGRHRFRDFYGLFKALLLVFNIVERAVLYEPGSVRFVKKLFRELIGLFRHPVVSQHVDKARLGEIRDIGLAVKDSPQYFLDVEVFAGFLADILVEPDLVRMLD